MANLLIGSSNLARFYKPEIFKDFRQYQMMKCTTMDSFNALMMEIEAGKNRGNNGQEDQGLDQDGLLTDPDNLSQTA
jgi:hypothetical protein